MTLMGAISTYRGLLVTRFFLGVAESGFFPVSPLRNIRRV